MTNVETKMPEVGNVLEDLVLSKITDASHASKVLDYLLKFRKTQSDVMNDDGYVRLLR